MSQNAPIHSAVCAAHMGGRRLHRRNGSSLRPVDPKLTGHPLEPCLMLSRRGCIRCKWSFWRRWCIRRTLARACRRPLSAAGCSPLPAPQRGPTGGQFALGVVTSRASVRLHRMHARCRTLLRAAACSNAPPRQHSDAPHQHSSSTAECISARALCPCLFCRVPLWPRLFCRVPFWPCLFCRVPFWPRLFAECLFGLFGGAQSPWSCQDW